MAKNDADRSIDRLYTPRGNRSSSTVSGSSGAVDSVNGETGTVVLTTDDISEGATNRWFTAAEETKLAGIEALADVTDAGNIASSIVGVADKATPIDADTIPLIDSAAANALKELSWANLKATLKTYNDGLYVDLTTNQNVAGLKSFTNNQIRFGSSAHVEPYTGYDAQGNVAAIIRYATAHAISTPFVSVLLSNNQTDGSNGLIGNVVFMNEAIAATEKRLAQISVYTDAATDEGKLIVFTWDGTVSVEALALDKSGIATFGNDVIVPSGVITIGVPEMSPVVRSLEIGDNGVAGGAQIRTSSTTDNGMIFHDENAADDEWLITHIVSDNSLRLAGWRTGISGAVTEHIKVLLGGEVVISGSGTSPALTGNMLAVYGSVAKETASKNTVATFGSSDTTQQMQLRVQVTGSATAASRAAGIQSVEAGVSVRTLMLQPDGGSVGIYGVTDPDAIVTIATPDSVLANEGYQLSLRSQRTTINTTNAMLGGIAFVSNDTNLTAPGTRTAVIRAVARATHTTTELCTAFQFLVTNVTTMSEAMRIESDGDILLGVIRALSSSGVRIEDDAGNLGILIEDGGRVNLGCGAAATNPGWEAAVIPAVGTDGTFGIDASAAGSARYAGFFTQVDGGYIQQASFGTTAAGTRYGQNLADAGEFLGVNLARILIGTFNSAPLIFGTNNTERMRVESGGVVLVGLTSVNANVLGIKAGTSSNDAAVGGVLYVYTTATGNVGTGEDNLASYSVPANTLAVNGQSLWFEARGEFAANFNAKRIRVRFGASGTNLIFDYIYSSSGGNWVLKGRIFRTGATTQKGYAEFYAGSATQEIDLENSLNQTLSGAVTFKITGEATTNNDIVLHSFILGWDDANT